MAIDQTDSAVCSVGPFLAKLKLFPGPAIWENTSCHHPSVAVWDLEPHWAAET